MPRRPGPAPQAALPEPGRLRTLGLRRIRHSVIRDDNAQTRGLINAGTTDQMVSWLDVLFLHSSTPDQMKQYILTALSSVDPSDTTGQAKAAAYLYLSSSMYQVQH